ncbi:MAG TPA: glutamate--tRNA ligase family protein, partial [Tepidisphaeraceae bacterium]|nr:glutamate--tRNA ligase family protein [Tepidisphaeraceae bacterium]
LPIILNTDGSKMGKRDRDKKIRHAAHLWMKNTKNTPSDLAAASSVERVTWWLEDDGRQLENAEQQSVMKVIGLKNTDLPEILVHDFRANGYLPESLLNFLALLGWSPGGDRERMSVEEMVQLFAIDAIGRSNAKFNRDKLLAFNTEKLASSSPEDLRAALRDFLSANPASPLHAASHDQLDRILKMNAGMHVLREVETKSAFLFADDDTLTWEPDAAEKVLLKNDRQGLNALNAIAQLLAGLPQWTAAAIEETVKAYCQTTNLGLGKVAQPIRVAVSGTTVSPPIFETLEFLGRDRALKRISRCLAAYQK